MLLRGVEVDVGLLWYIDTAALQQFAVNRKGVRTDDTIIRRGPTRFAKRRRDAAVQSRKLQEQSVEVEQLTFDVGVATNYLVIQYQTYLAQARSTEVAAKGAYAKAKVALDRATANTLEVNRVSIKDAQDGRVSRPSSQNPHP